MSKFKYNWNVARWLGDVEIFVPEVPAHIVLSLIHVESAGDEFARRPKSQFCGLLQMGRPASVDVGFRDIGLNTAQKLVGDGPAALRAFAAYVARYRHLFGDTSPEWYALLWKGGPGYTEMVRALVRAGVEFDKAVAMAGEEVGFTANEYIEERFRPALAVWSQHKCG